MTTPCIVMETSRIKSADELLECLRSNYIFEIVVEYGSDHGKTSEPPYPSRHDSLIGALKEADAYTDRVKAADGGWSWATVRVRRRPAALRWTLVLTCDGGHAQRVVLDGFTREAAEDYAAILDGTSPMFVHPPGPESTLNKCRICGKTFHAKIEESKP